jgi:hypothetical protein
MTSHPHLQVRGTACRANPRLAAPSAPAPSSRFSPLSFSSRRPPSPSPAASTSAMRAWPLPTSSNSSTTTATATSRSRAMHRRAPLPDRARPHRNRLHGATHAGAHQHNRGAASRVGDDALQRKRPHERLGSAGAGLRSSASTSGTRSHHDGVEQSLQRTICRSSSWEPMRSTLPTRLHANGDAHDNECGS